MFDAVLCINLDRRPERWERFRSALPADWPYARPQRWSAVDGKQCVVPSWFHGGPGAWGCLQSHLAVWQWQLEMDLESVLVLEDDAVFCHNAVAVMRETMELVPPDWCQIYFGGQHLNTDTMPPETILHNKLIRCRYTNRTHAYAIRASFAEEAIEVISEPNDRDPRVQHVDYLLGDLHDSHCVYAPWRFCVGQASGASDVSSVRHKPVRTPEHWWNQFPITDPETARVI